ncbi:universal stress protein [Commensalibacter oyaizuii]|uniref:Universal stress protein n=1 Tax=Commensalibacter oyaizuii TaxID=3043873 RepID=A0ABT6Q2M4_9PROT|nr:universal stress protein [Commensalibacter sp. TBRC 16381]MDI2091270.1 universal stress protein [Commensalibacter sp. TBRC 16381]
MLHIKKILIPIQGTSLSHSTLTTAYLLSQSYDAHLAVLHVHPDKKDIIPLTGEGLSGTMIEEVMNIAEHESIKRLKFTRKIFDDFIDAHGIEQTSLAPSDEMNGKITASFTTLTGRENSIITYCSRLSDITVLSHPNSDEHVSSSEILHTLLFESGRPVVIAPKENPTSVAKRICIAWNGSAESAAALHASLRWIHSAEKVGILYSADYEDQGNTINDVSDYLKFYGIDVDLLKFNADKNTGENMLATCTDYGCDLLCMGAYSHPRWKQLILGGVTSYMLEHANLAVLMYR